MEKIYSFKHRLLLFFLFLSNCVFAQTNTLTGRVMDESNLPLPSASVAVKGTTLKASTDVNGYFTIINAPSGSQTVVITYIGYKTLEMPVTINGKSSLKAQLQPSSLLINEVAVIGYGTVRKSDATGAVSVVTAKDFNKGAVNSMQDAISGKLPGVVVTSTSGAPGNSSTIMIRGGASLNASNSPLIVVDNVPLDNNVPGGSANLLTSINPNDVENITVLKDASATAIFGARASNGVILITTKRGSKATKISYNTTASISVLTKHLEVYSGDEFRELIAKEMPDKVSLLGTASTDWQKEIYQNAFGQDHNLSISGTAKNLPYRLSAGFNNTDGALKNYNFTRNTLAIALDPSLLKNHLNIHLNLKGLYNKNNFSAQSAVANAINFDPTQPVFNGNTAYHGYTTWTNGGIDGVASLLATANPVAQVDLTDDRSKVSQSIGNIQFDYKMPFLPDLHANLNLGYDYSKSEGHNNVPEGTGWINSPTPGGGRVLNYDNVSQNQLMDVYLNYKKDLKSIKSTIDVTAGHSFSHFYREGYGRAYNVALTDSLPSTDFKTEYNLLSFFGRVNYSLQNKYLLTFTLRSDATSRFSPETRVGYFPAGAVTWKIKEESFLKGNTTISDLKLRLGYGVTGQQEINNGNYPYFGVYTIGDATSRYKLGDKYYNTLRPDAYDPNIKWETTTTTNIGLDFGFLNNKLTGSLDVYDRQTKDLLSIITSAAGTTFSGELFTNVGSMENRGVELGLNAAIINKKNFTWQFGYNISYNQNKITNLSKNDDPNVKIADGSGVFGNFGKIRYHAVNSPRSSYYVYKQIYDTDGKPIDDAFVDINGDNVINESDLYLYQNPDPTVLMGINSRFTHKKWDFSFSGRASLGNYNYNNVASASTYESLFKNGFFRNQSTAADDTQFRTTEKVPYSDYYIENASFFRMDNINLGYTLPDVNKVKIHLNAGVQNPFVITNYTGLDPEISGGLDNNFFPRARMFQLGLNCTF